jgi:hypothetical protein
VRQYVQERKRALGFAERVTWVPQSYDWGVEAQVDWYESYADLAGERVKLQVFAMRSMASGAAFHYAYLHATQQAFLEAHELAFIYFGGVFRRLKYDNLRQGRLFRAPCASLTCTTGMMLLRCLLGQSSYSAKNATLQMLCMLIGALRLTPSLPIEARSHEIDRLLSTNKLLQTDRSLRLFALSVKDQLDGEIDSTAARADWISVVTSARELNKPKWIYRAQGQIGFADYYDGDLASCQRQVASALIAATKAGDLRAEVFFFPRPQMICFFKECHSKLLTTLKGLSRSQKRIPSSATRISLMTFLPIPCSALAK